MVTAAIKKHRQRYSKRYRLPDLVRFSFTQIANRYYEYIATPSEYPGSVW